MPALRFAATKIQPPRPAVARVRRTQLDEALAAALDTHRVVLLQAPAGFGKTLALAAQQQAVAATPGRALAWIALDEDDDAERLMACFVAALEPLDPPWRTAPEALVELAGSGAAGLARAAAELVNALAGIELERGLVVLDDLHRVEAADAFALLDRVVLRLPAHWTLVLASRTPPPLALARLRASGELAEFTQDSLRFSPEETGALLAQEALPAGDEAARTLFERTAGWPAGLRLALAAQRARGGAAAASPLRDRPLFDYLAAEVLDELPTELHDFLLRTAVLPALTPARAAAVSGDQRALQWMQEIERRGLFATALDADEPTLVLHDLFRDALAQRLAERRPDELPALLRRAAAGETDVLRRIGWLLRAGDWDAADETLADEAARLFVQGSAGEVLRIVEQFPPARRSPRLLRLAGTACALRWHWPDMARWYAQAVQAATAAGDRDERQRAQARLAYALYPLDRNDEALALVAALRAEQADAAQPPMAPATGALLAMAEAYQAFRTGAHERLPGLYAEVLAVLESGEGLWRWWECLPPYNWSTIAGMPALIGRYLQGALPRLADEPLPMRADLRLLQALRALWAGDVEAGEALLRAAEDDLAWLAVSGEAEVGCGIARLMFDAVRGRAAAVHARLETLLRREDDQEAQRRQLWRHQLAVHGVRVADTLGDEAALRHWAGLLRENPLHDPSAQNPRAVATRARAAAAAGRWDEALLHFEALAPRLPGIDVNGQRCDLTLRHAHALCRAGRTGDAAARLRPLVARWVSEGVRGPALLAGPAVLQALAEAPWGALLEAGEQAELRRAADRARALRENAAGAGAVADGPPAAMPSSAATVAAPGAEPLSQREREVLERIAAGDGNKHIARTLDISPHTVKRHVANILGKLGLASRGQAAAWWRVHGG